MTQFRSLVLKLRRKYPKFKVIIKEDSKFMQGLFKWTGMKWWNPSFMSDFVTTVGFKTYMPMELVGTEAGYDVLRHEAVHIEDYAKYGVMFILSYLFCLPTILTFRAFWEFRGYTESLKAIKDRFGAVTDEDVDWAVKQFTGSTYGFMFPFKNLLTKKFKKKVAKWN